MPPFRKDREPQQLVEAYEDYMLIRGVEHISGKFIPRCLHKIDL